MWCCHHNVTNDLLKDIKLNFPGSNYFFKVNNRNTKKNCEIFSKLMMKTPSNDVLLSSLSLRVKVEETLKHRCV